MDQISTSISKSRINIGIVGVIVVTLLFVLPNLLILAGYKVFKITDIRDLISHEIYIWLILLVMLVFAYNVEKKKFLPWDDSFYPYKWYFRHFFKLIFNLILLTLFIQLFVQFAGINEHSRIISGLKPILQAYKPLVLFLSFTAGITEELLIRGYIFSRLEPFFKSPRVTIVITAAIFGLLHLPYGTVTNVIFPFIMGIIFSTHYYKYRNIKILILCHFFWDLLSLGLNAR